MVSQDVWFTRLRKRSLFDFSYVNALLLVVCHCCIIEAKGLPPSITINSLREILYKVGDEVTLDCELHGVPYPEFHWRKDGIVVKATSNVVILRNGGIRILTLTDLDEGYYKCYASNIYGTAMSDVIALRRAMIHQNTATDVDVYDLTEGRLLMLPCRHTNSFPRPNYSWIVVSKSGSQETVAQDSRVQIDEQGNLHFAYVEVSDSRLDATYKCVANNVWLNEQNIGSSAKLRISADQTAESTAAPRYGFSSPETVVGLLGGSVTLRCFFYGRPIPKIHWYRKDGLPLPPRKFVFSNYNTELVIKNLTFADEAAYICNASIMDNSISRRITVEVDAAPKFHSGISQSWNINASEDVTVSFNCHTESKPTATVTWSRDGVQVTAGTLPPRYSLNSDGTVLTISNLCRECPDGKSDLQVIQCNASNQHGYAFGAGYVNVLRKTTVLTSPQYLFIEVAKRAIARFTCTANSDPSTPVSTNWYRIHEGSMTKIVLTGDDGDGAVVDKDHSLIFRSTPGSVKWLEYLGVYRCQADNGYSMESSDIQLIAMDLPSTRSKQDVTTNASVTEAEVAAANTELYWIAVLVALLIALLVIIIVIIMLCCCRGDIYNVDEIEHKGNKDPEKELKDNELKEYCRPEEKTTTRGSRSSVVTSSSHDEDFNEIEDEDDGNFGETGSFIGAYVEKR